MCDLLLCDGKKKQPAVKMYDPSELEIEGNNLLRKMVGAKPYKPMTNADRIRAMTDEELAEWITKHDCHTNLYGYAPKDTILCWLKQEVEDVNND